MRNNDDFLLELHSLLPLPKNNDFISADGTEEVDLKKAARNIEKVIKKYKKEHKLTNAEVIHLKRLAIERYYVYIEAWKN